MKSKAKLYTPTKRDFDWARRMIARAKPHAPGTGRIYTDQKPEKP